MEILKARSPEEALEGADVVVTATSSRQPVFPGKALSAGAHINAIGAFKPEMQEVDEETILRSRIFVDSVAACLEEAGDLIIPLKKGLLRQADIQAELGEVIAGKNPDGGMIRRLRISNPWAMPSRIFRSPRQSSSEPWPKGLARKWSYD